MKTILYLFDVILFVYFISFTKEDICPDGEISISALGKCKTFDEFLVDEDLTIKSENLLYLASNNEGKIEKNDYKLEIYKLSDPKLQSHNMRKSKLYIPNSCLDKMEKNEDIKLDRTKGIVILVYNYTNTNKNNISDIFFIIRHNSDNSNIKYINSKTFDFSFCHEDPILFDDEIELERLRYDYDDNATINIDTILYGRKFGFDLFDPYNEFLKNICIKFTSEHGTDVTLDSRLEDYFQNITFCDDKENARYMSYNYSAEKKSFTYRCAFGYYESEEKKDSFLQQINTELKSLVSVSNLEVIYCYKQFLNLRDITRNYGGVICIFVLIIQIICFLIFCFCGIKPIEEKLNNLFLVGESILKGFLKLAGRDLNPNETEENQLNNGKPKKLLNIWGKVKLIRQRKLEKEMLLKQQQEKQLEQEQKDQNQNLIQIKEIQRQNTLANPNKKRKSIKAKHFEDGNNIININNKNEGNEK